MESTITFNVTVAVVETCLIKLITRKIKNKKFKVRKINFIVSFRLKKATQIAKVKKIEILINVFFSFFNDKVAKKKIAIIEQEKDKFRYFFGKTGKKNTMRIVKKSNEPLAKVDSILFSLVENILVILSTIVIFISIKFILSIVFNNNLVFIFLHFDGLSINLSSIIRQSTF